LYVNSNIAVTGQNSVIALVNDGAGNLSPVAGSPFATGGTGVNQMGSLLNDAPWDADGQIMLNPSATLLFAVNGHSNNISSFKINSDGSLTAVAGSPFASGGPQPASIGYQDNALGNGVSMMIVANKDSDFYQTQTAPNFTTFAVSSGGVLTKGPTLTLPAGSSPAHVLVKQGAKQYFFGIIFAGTKSINSYKLTRTGAMSLINSVGLAGQPVGGAFSPISRGIYVTVPPQGLVSLVNYDPFANLSLFKSVADPGVAVCWAAVNKAGTRMYTGETVSGTVTVWDVSNPPRTPTVLQTLLMSGTSPYPTMVQLDPTEKFLYVLDRQGTVHVLDVATDGTISEPRPAYNLGLPDNTVPPLGLAVALK
jgi:6-phosphogluconolactonase (cycloisomerase 2 family)